VKFTAVAASASSRGVRAFGSPAYPQACALHCVVRIQRMLGGVGTRLLAWD